MNVIGVLFFEILPFRHSILFYFFLQHYIGTKNGAKWNKIDFMHFIHCCVALSHHFSIIQSPPNRFLFLFSWWFLSRQTQISFRLPITVRGDRVSRAEFCPWSFTEPNKWMCSLIVPLISYLFVETSFEER